MPSKKSPKKRGEIVAHSIVLKDAKGKVRIIMDAGSGDGAAAICLFGEGGRSIQIATAPTGGLSIELLGNQCHVALTLGMSSEQDGGLSIRDRKGRLGTELGSSFDPGTHRLVLFHDGQPYCNTPSPQKRKAPKR